ncbi:MAG: DUF1846 domain-containing protein [Corallococcus sp.]|nr:DUF1846 domain-containing protein [Corallococcus sp.]MCM1359987.1 DUF1846 domain-containing protein [Corallococcus sp.]MCM1395544.1 DUF1846 domain-containing protein [Corallococcus sp.]
MKQGFDNGKYIQLQSEKIAERVNVFGGKLYLEFGGKLFDDYHASRVLPGFLPDSKIVMLCRIKEQVEVVIAVSAADIAQNKVRADIGITYDEDVLRLYDELTNRGLYVGSIVISQYSEENVATVKYKQRLENMGIRVYRHYKIEGYPSNVTHIVSDDGFGKNDYIETSRNIVVVTAPGPGSGKMATCLSQMYHDNKRGIRCGYAKYETFPVWNLPLNHPVNVAYEAATADLADVNMIDPWHMQAYGQSTVNYNRDVEVFPVLNAIFTKVLGYSPYKSPTDMGVNMAGYCISDDEICSVASRQEIVRRYLNVKVQVKKGAANNAVLDKLDIITSKLGLSENDRIEVAAARNYASASGSIAGALTLPDGRQVLGKASGLLSCASSLVLNAVKPLANLPDVKLIAPQALEPIQLLKKESFGEGNSQLHADEALIALSVSAAVNPMAELALCKLPALRGCQAHFSAMLSPSDEKTLRKLGIQATCDAVYPSGGVFLGE